MVDASRRRAGGRAFNRFRFLLDREVTPATVLDWICDSHPDSAVLSPIRELPYPGLSEEPIRPRDVLSFASRVGEVLAISGMRRGDRVAIFKRNDVDYVFISLAIVRAGGVAMPINPGMPIEALSSYLRYAEARILCCDRHTFAQTIGTRARLPTIDRWLFTDAAPDDDPGATVLRDAIAEVPGDTPPADLRDDSHVVLAHTSGTTGTPKAVVCTARSLLEGLRVHYRTEPPLPWKRVGIAGHFSHLVYQIGLTTLMLSNQPTWALDATDPERSLEAIERQRINLFVAFPELYLRMYAHGLDAHDLSSIRIWISVADTSHEAHMSAFCSHGAQLKLFGRKFGAAAFVEPLGSSEIGGPALRRIWTPRSRIRCQRRVGRRMPGGPRVKVADEAGREMPPGRAGNLMVRGSTLFAGYWTADGRLNQATTDGWWATGDVARRDRRGRIYHLDRAGDVIDTARGPFYSLPAEDVLHTYPGVDEAVVVGVPGEAGHQEPVGLVWSEASPLSEARLRAWANERIDGPAKLRAVSCVAFDEIPRGLTGKVLKRELRDRYRSEASGR